jgi:hypothetical protein
MTNSQFIAERNIATRGAVQVPDEGRNAFEITAGEWASKPRVDVTLSGDGEPVPLTKVSVNADDKSVFKLKYKKSKDQNVWDDVVLPGDVKATVSVSDILAKLKC